MFIFFKSTSGWIRRYHSYLLSCDCIHTHSITILFFLKHSRPYKQFLCYTFFLLSSSFSSLVVLLQLEFNGQAHLALTQFIQMENKASFSSHFFHGRNDYSAGSFCCLLIHLLARSVGGSRAHPTIHHSFFCNVRCDGHSISYESFTWLCFVCWILL